MLQNDGNSSGDTAQRKAKRSLAEKQMIGVSVFAIICLLFVSLMNAAHIDAPKPLLGIGALLLILGFSTTSILMLREYGGRAKPPYWYLKNVGFWLTAFACAAKVCTLFMMVLFELILPVPAFLPTPFVDSLPWVDLGALLLMFLGFTVWLAQMALRARREFRRWLETGEW